MMMRRDLVRMPTLPLCPSPQKNDNGALVETIARLRAENTVLFQKKRRLDAQLEGQNKEIRTLQVRVEDGNRGRVLPGRSQNALSRL